MAWLCTAMIFKNSYWALLFFCEGDGPDMQSALAQWTGQRTVPNVFINGKHIGGCDGEPFCLHYVDTYTGILAQYDWPPSTKLCYTSYCLLAIGFCLTCQFLCVLGQTLLHWRSQGSWCICWGRLEQSPVILRSRPWLLSSACHCLLGRHVACVMK